MLDPPRRGRPPFAPGDKQTAVLYLKLTPAERAEFDAASHRAGYEQVSLWAKDVLRRAAKRTR